MNQPQAISPERQMKAAQVASVFNPLHNYIASLYPINPATGEPTPTEQLRQAHIRLEEAAFWVIQSVLKFGTAPVAPPAANDQPDPTAPPEADGTESNATAGNI